MILLLGDIHGDVPVLKNAIQRAELVEATCLIQLGVLLSPVWIGMKLGDYLRKNP